MRIGWIVDALVLIVADSIAERVTERVREVVRGELAEAMRGVDERIVEAEETITEAISEAETTVVDTLSERIPDDAFDDGQGRWTDDDIADEVRRTVRRMRFRLDDDD